MLHRLGTEQSEDVEVFAEADPAWFIGLAATRLGWSALIVVHRHDASETHVVDLDRPTAKPLLITPRRSGLFYDVMDHGDCFYIRTNSQARDFKIVIAPRAAPDEANWRDIVPHRDGRFLADATLLRDFLVVLAREDSRPRLIVHDLRSGVEHEIAFERGDLRARSGDSVRIRLATRQVQFFFNEPVRGGRRLRLRHPRSELSSRSRRRPVSTPGVMSPGSFSPSPTTASACRCRF